LIPEIRNELAIQRPQTIHQAIGLAKLIESKIKDSKPRYQKPFQTPTTSAYSRPQPTIPTSQPTPPLPAPNPKQTTTTPPKLPIRKLNQSQLQERRALGLCYNCDEKFVAGHKCASGRFLLLLVDDEIEPAVEVDETDPPPEPVDPDPADTYFHLSTHAITC